MTSEMGGADTQGTVIANLVCIREGRRKEGGGRWERETVREEGVGLEVLAPHLRMVSSITPALCS